MLGELHVIHTFVRMISRVRRENHVRCAAKTKKPPGLEQCQWWGTASRPVLHNQFADLIPRVSCRARQHGQEKRDDDVPLDHALEALEDERGEGLQAEEAHLSS